MVNLLCKTTSQCLPAQAFACKSEILVFANFVSPCEYLRKQALAGRFTQHKPYL
jgi:hypothetical protein